MSYEQEMTLPVPAEDLLSPIWYSDGSGHGQGVAPNSLPEDWGIVSIRLSNDGQVEIWLKRVSP